MKVIQKFNIVKDDHAEFPLRLTLDQLERAINMARTLMESDLLLDHEGEQPLKFLEHDYDLVIGNFGIDFLHSQSAARPGNQADPPAVSGSADQLGGYLPPSDQRPSV